MSYKERTFINYKIKIPEGKSKSEALLNIEDKHYYIGGDVWICLWFRDGKMGNQISLEYNRFTEEEIQISNSCGNSVGKHFVESYLPMENCSFLIKCLKVFNRIIEVRDSKEISRGEFLNMVVKEFGGMGEDVKSI